MESSTKTQSSSYTNYADPAQWRLIITMSATSLQGWLKNTAASDGVVRKLADAHWEQTIDGVLQRIENIVYDNPALLDDYEADILIDTNKVLYIPQELCEEENDAESAFGQVFPSGCDELLYDKVSNDAKAAYHLTRGLKAFLDRTFPGARVHHKLTPMIRRLAEQTEGRTIYVDIEGNNLSLIAMEDKRFIGAVSRQFNDYDEATWHILNFRQTIKFNSPKDIISLSGDSDECQNIESKLLKFSIGTTNTQLVNESELLGTMSTSAAICAAKKSSTQI
jgi:hypothetical protein